MDSNEDTEKIREFRNTLKSIKKTILDKITYSTQSVSSLKKVSHRLIQFYMLLKPVVVNGLPIETIPIPEVRDLFYNTLDQSIYPRSSYYQNQIEYYLKRDYIDYPFTIDADDINLSAESYEVEGAPHIVENNIRLTQ